MRRNLVQLALALSVVSFGCDRKPAAPAVVANAPTDAPATRPTTEPGVRPPSFITLDGQPTEFPAAKLTLAAPEAGRVAAELFSDDPPQTFHRDFSGNSFYLPMTLQIDSARSLPGAIWSMRRNESDDSDSVAGIFLEGSKVALTPLDVTVTFEPLDEKETVVLLRGTFRQLDAKTASGLPKDVKVSARLAAEVKTRE